jgi:exodeoxyribonuclease VII large subunit
VGATLRLFDRRRSELRAAGRALPTPENLLAGPRQRLDLAAAKLGPALARNARAYEQRLAQLDRRLHVQSPAARLATLAVKLDSLGGRLVLARGNVVLRQRERIARARDRLEAVAARAEAAFARLVQRRRDRLGGLWSLAASLGPQAVLARGYALVRDENGVLLRQAAAARPGMTLQVTLADGSFGAVVPGGAPPRPAPRKSATSGGQGDLF